MKATRRSRIVTALMTLGSGGVVLSTDEGCVNFDDLFGSLVSPGVGRQDTDGDGFTDAQELQSGTDSFDQFDHP